MSEINVTPMVDVMLVLLIIFMVAAPLLTVGVDVPTDPSSLPAVELPKTEAGLIQPEALNVTVDGEGRIFIQNTQVSFDELVPKLAAIREAGGGNTVQLRGDDRTPYGNVAKVLARVAKAGFNTKIMTDQVE